MSFGANLKRERELRGISLEEIAKATKISVRLLAAIESDRHDLLPGGVFRTSFIKSYARYLGMNEEKVLQEYCLTTETVPPPSLTEEKFDQWVLAERDPATRDLARLESLMAPGEREERLELLLVGRGLPASAFHGGQRVPWAHAA